MLVFFTLMIVVVCCIIIMHYPVLYSVVLLVCCVIVLLQKVHYIERESNRLQTLIDLVAVSGVPAIRLIICSNDESNSLEIYKVYYLLQMQINPCQLPLSPQLKECRSC